MYSLMNNQSVYGLLFLSFIATAGAAQAVSVDQYILLEAQSATVYSLTDGGKGEFTMVVGDGGFAFSFWLEDPSAGYARLTEFTDGKSELCTGSFDAAERSYQLGILNTSLHGGAGPFEKTNALLLNRKITNLSFLRSTYTSEVEIKWVLVNEGTTCAQLLDGSGIVSQPKPTRTYKVIDNLLDFSYLQAAP